jgi:hypothetical protein
VKSRIQIPLLALISSVLVEALKMMRAKAGD